MCKPGDSQNEKDVQSQLLNYKNIPQKVSQLNRALGKRLLFWYLHWHGFAAFSVLIENSF